MKNILFFIIGLLAIHLTIAQTCTITGSVKNTKDSVLALYFLTADGNYRHQNQIIKINSDRSFKESISLNQPTFINLEIGNYTQKLLLSPKRNLHLEIDESKEEKIVTISGNASAENKLMNEMHFGKHSFYTKNMNDWKDNPYAKLTKDSIHQQIMIPVNQQLNVFLKKINAAKIPKHLKKLLQQEVKYFSQTQLFDFAQNYMRWAENPEYEIFLKEVVQLYPLPDSAALVSGFYANMMLSNQIQYHLAQMAKNIRTNPEKTKKEIEQALKMPFDEIGRQTRALGERFILNWLYAKNLLPNNIQDRVLFNTIMCASDTIFKDISVSKVLLDTMRTYFPNSKYLKDAMTEVNQLQDAHNASITNKKIIIHDDKKPRTLNELVAPYLGKTIYIDIWGTWCGPCKFEMGYVKELKKRFSDKDIVFLYLDMDDDELDSRWKKSIYSFGIEGEHYRLTDKEIEPIWNTIKEAGGKINSYPTFVIINKEGKLVHANAERPSSKEVLYKQLDALLQK